MPINRNFESEISQELPLAGSCTEVIAQGQPLIDLAYEARTQSDIIGRCPPELPCARSKAGLVAPTDAFYLGDMTKLKCSDLANGGVFDTTERIEQPLDRSAEEVKLLTVRETGASYHDGTIPNFRIAADGTIMEIRDPHKKINDFDPAISIEIDNGLPGQERDFTERQKAALRQLAGYVKVNWPENVQLEEGMLDQKMRIFGALFVEPTVEGEDWLSEGSYAYCWPVLRKPRPVRHYWQDNSEHPFKQLFGTQEGRPCGEYDRVNQMTEEQKEQFVERVKKLISRNEGKYNSIVLNDNGAGLSVGIAQWNQRKGELPTLIREWYKVAEKENEGLDPGKPNRFERIFGQFAQEWLRCSPDTDGKHDSDRDTFIRNYNFTDETEEGRYVLKQMKDALDDPLFRKVQDELVRGKVRRAIDLADRYGHHSTRFVAQVADVANQYGWSGCESILRKANVANIPEDTEGECMAIQSVIDNTPPKQDKNGNPIPRTKRDKALDEEFPPKQPSSLRLVTKYIF